MNESEKISETTIREINVLLNTHTSVLWNSYESILLDDNRQLFVKIILSDSEEFLHDRNNSFVKVETPSIQKLDLINKTLFDILDGRLARRKGDYSWMVCIYVQKQIDAIMGGLAD